MLKFLPPQYGVNDPVEWVSPTDKWDNARFNREIEAEVERRIALLPPIAEPEPGADLGIHAAEHAKRKAEIKRLRAEVSAAHPVSVYMSGSTRFDADARMVGFDGVSVTASDYLADEPTVFVLRDLDDAEYKRGNKADDDFHTFACLGLVTVRHAGETHEVERDKATGQISRTWVDALARSDRNLLTHMGMAVYRLCQQGSVSRAEGKS